MQQRNNIVVKLLVVLVYTVLSALGMVLIKKGGKDVKCAAIDGKIDLSINMVFCLGLLLYLFSFILWLYVLQLFTLTYISPVVYGGVYILITVFSTILLDERINVKMIMASILIIAGIVLASMSNNT